MVQFTLLFFTNCIEGESFVTILYGFSLCHPLFKENFLRFCVSLRQAIVFILFWKLQIFNINGKFIKYIYILHINDPHWCHWTAVSQKIWSLHICSVTYTFITIFNCLWLHTSQCGIVVEKVVPRHFCLQVQCLASDSAVKQTISVFLDCIRAYPSVLFLW